MELALSLGDAPNSKKPFGFFSKPSSNNYLSSSSSNSSSLMALGFCVGLGHDSGSGSGSGSVHDDEDDDDDDDDDDEKTVLPGSGSGLDPPVQLDLLPLAPVPRSSHQSSSHLQFSWLSDRLIPELGCSEGTMVPSKETEDRTAVVATAVSCLQIDLGGPRIIRKRSLISDMEIMETERGSSRNMSDDEENIGCARKKLRLSKDQSAFLEESFKEHSTLNPKQKLALAKQLNLRPRQVEVWFQNRRARTKLKQTEVDCEYLRRCCETLTEENRRLQKELQELRALKTSQPFYMHLPATTLTMCPSCERVVTTAPAASVTPTTTTVPAPTPPSLCLANKPRILPFPPLHQAAS